MCFKVFSNFLIFGVCKTAHLLSTLLSTILTIKPSSGSYAPRQNYTFLFNTL